MHTNTELVKTVGELSICPTAKAVAFAMKLTGITNAKELAALLNIPERTIYRSKNEIAIATDGTATTANAATSGTATTATSGNPQKEIPPTPPKEKTTTLTTVSTSSSVVAASALPDAKWLFDQLMDAAKGIVRQDAADLQIVSVPLGWLQAGASLEIDILPLLRAKAQKSKGPHVKSWNYFTQMVADALAARTNPLPTANVVPMRPTAAAQRPIYKLPTAPVYDTREGIEIDDALRRGLITEEQAAEFRRQAASA